MIRVVILGSSASVPSVQRNLSAVALRYEGDVYLFDCGEGTQRQMMKFGVSYAKVKAIFITHPHADHVLGVAGLVQTLEMVGRKEPLHIFAPKGAASFIDRLISLNERSFVRVEEIDENFVYKGEGFTIHAFPAEHCKGSVGFVFQENERRNFEKKKADALGIKGRMFSALQEKGEIEVGGKRIKYEDVSIPKKGKKIVITGDTLATERVEKESKEADLLIHDATFSEELKEEAKEKLHATASEAARAAKKAKVKQLILTHISNRYDKADALEKEAQKIFKNAVVAYDGLEILV